ncbi:unnamed protein product [Trichobilharzia szidati]|nr:unnamed protein product [Trichobilharzia szidati]
MTKDYKLTQMYMPFYAACTSATLGFLFFFLSFSSPYWLQSFDRVHSSFLHMGIWSVCFDKFVHPQDYHANVLTGCFWVYDRFFFKIGIWQWLNPYWLIGVQVLMTIAFTTKCCVILILVLYHLLFGHPAAESTMALVGEAFIALLLTISILLFGISSQSRVWMPRPDQYFLSWSFGFIILAAICSYISAGFLYCVSYTDRAAQEEVEKYEAVETNYGVRSVLSGRIGSGGLYSGALSAIGGAGGVVVKVPSTGVKPEQVIALDSDLRRMDTGRESVSLFSPSVTFAHQNNRYAGEVGSRPSDDQLSDNGSRTLSPIPGSEHSQETPLYVNQPRAAAAATTTRYTNQRDLSSGSPPDSQSYSPLEVEQAEENQSMLSDNVDSQQGDYIPPRHSLPLSQKGYTTTATKPTSRYSRY